MYFGARALANAVPDRFGGEATSRAQQAADRTERVQDRQEGRAWRQRQHEDGQRREHETRRHRATMDAASQGRTAETQAHHAAMQQQGKQRLALDERRVAAQEASAAANQRRSEASVAGQRARETRQAAADAKVTAAADARAAAAQEKQANAYRPDADHHFTNAQGAPVGGSGEGIVTKHGRLDSVGTEFSRAEGVAERGGVETTVDVQSEALRDLGRLSPLHQRAGRKGAANMDGPDETWELARMSGAASMQPDLRYLLRVAGSGSVAPPGSESPLDTAIASLEPEDVK